MRRFAILALAALVAAPVARAAPRHRVDLDAAFAPHFAPFDDQAAKDGWEALTPSPMYLTAGAGKSAAAPLMLRPGAYRIMALCDCAMMDFTLLGPDARKLPPEKVNDQAAMYTLDVHAAGAYLAGVDMDDCGQKQCAVGVKVYRKKS